MNLRRRFRISVDRTSSTRFTVQDLADFVELCAQRDLDPRTPITFRADGREVRNFTMEAVGGEKESALTSSVRRSRDGR
jgi:hypothetical protein